MSENNSHERLRTIHPTHDATSKSKLEAMMQRLGLTFQCGFHVQHPVDPHTRNKSIYHDKSHVTDNGALMSLARAGTVAVTIGAQVMNNHRHKRQKTTTSHHTDMCTIVFPPTHQETQCDVEMLLRL